MDVQGYGERAAIATRRFDALQQQAASIPVDDPDARSRLNDMLLELSAVVAELRATVEDLSDQHRMLDATANRYAGLFELAPDAYLVTTADGIVRDANREAAALFGVEHWSGANPLVALIATEDRRKFFQFLGRVREEAHVPLKLEVTMRRIDRVEFPATVRAIAADDADGERIVRWLVRDDTERRAIEARLAHEATHDVMTGIPNRSAFVAMLEAALVERLRDNRSVGVLFIDLDGFKAVNDRFGHETGDELLKACVGRIRGALREGDVLGRLGGDEFAAACVVDTPMEAEHIAERVRHEVSEPYSIGALTLATTASIGVAVASGMEEADDIIGNADIAMYRAKRLRKNRVEVFGDSLRETTIARRELDGYLRGALDRHELKLWYQPTIDLRDGHVTSVEALLRWELPGRGLLTASDFLDVAEEYGLLVPIGEWVLREACDQAREWEKAFPFVPIVTSVNMTPLELVQAGVARTARAVIDRSGADPSRICLELSDRAAISIGDINPAVLDELHDLGLRIGIDNFGAGYTSIARLRSLPLDVLKLDPRLVASVESDREDRLIIGAVAQLGDALGFDVVGEGVERAGQVDALNEIGCHRAQGFYLGVPQPADDVADLIAARNGG